jgi:hypothetical protein
MELGEITYHIQPETGEEPYLTAFNNVIDTLHSHMNSRSYDRILTLGVITHIIFEHWNDGNFSESRAWNLLSSIREFIEIDNNKKLEKERSRSY